MSKRHAWSPRNSARRRAVLMLVDFWPSYSARVLLMLLFSLISSKSSVSGMLAPWDQAHTHSRHTSAADPDLV